MTIENLHELSNISRKQGQLLERLVAAMHVAETPDVAVRWNDAINGRQFDVTLRFRKGVHNYLTVIECKDFADAVPVEKVEAFITKANDAGADKVVMVSSAGFQSGALAVAEKHSVRLFTIEEAFPKSAPPAKSMDGIAFVSLEFRCSGSSQVLSFPSRSSRFAYIWKQGKLKHAGSEISVEAFARGAHPADFTTLPSGREERTIGFKKGTIFAIPHEDPVRVASMKYARAPETFGIPNEIPDGSFLGFDPFVTERLQLSFILRDEEGTVVQENDLRGLPFGFDTILKAGAFYESPALGFHYYLDKVEPELLTWTAIETYQHGMLMQSTFTQKPQYATGMVTITDPVVLKRLRRMLAARDARTTARSMPL